MAELTEMEMSDAELLRAMKSAARDFLKAVKAARAAGLDVWMDLVDYDPPKAPAFQVTADRPIELDDEDEDEG